MKCPKCHYVSFEPEPRCRNCGYGFSLAEIGSAPQTEPGSRDRESDAASTPPQAPLRPATAADVAPFAQRVPQGASPSGSAPRPSTAPGPAPRQSSDVPPAREEWPSAGRPSLARGTVADRPFASAVADWEPELVKTSAPPTAELPLFVKPRGSDARAASLASSALDEPLVRVPVETRPPLAVRRPVAESAPPSRPPVPREAARRLGPLDRDLLEDLERIERAERTAAASHHDASEDEGLTSIGGGRRLAAAALDAALIGGLSAGVLWLTLRWCDLAFDELAVLPAVPMLAFLALVGLGYLLVFTAAGGQTIGKMACGLRVIGEADGAGPLPDGRLTSSQAIWRVLLSIASVLALGLGLLPAVLGRDEAVHDRLAHTRVVRA